MRSAALAPLAVRGRHARVARESIIPAAKNRAIQGGVGAKRHGLIAEIIR
jgi:hypothetical protein